MKIRLALFTALILLAVSCTGVPASGNDTPAQNGENPPEITQENPPAGTDWSAPDDRAPKFLFIHHSTGDGFLFDGGMWEMLENAGFEVHDRTYDDGWVGDHTDPPDWPVTFAEHYSDMISWELSSGEKYDIVAFKSCFPASQISSDEQLEEYKSYYNTVKEVIRHHPETLFIPFTTPPLVPNATDPDAASRAREFSIWLTEDYAGEASNIAVYNLFDILAENDPSRDDLNCLKREFMGDENDSHPNTQANQAVAVNFTQWLSDLVTNK